MRFGGHETFTVREGWLHKGLKLLVEDRELLVDEYAADWLGVGRNMAKSIRHWLQATRLAEPFPMGKSQKKPLLCPTEFGRTVWDHDPYFTESGTWWALHVHLVHSPEHALSWSWFFNHFYLDRFDRSVCLESLQRHLQLARQRTPSPKTLERDLACLLASYARPIPPGADDPEDGTDCPFRELGLMSHFRTSGYYQLDLGPKDIPPELLGYAVALAFPDAADGTESTDITLQAAARKPNGPGKAFALTSEALFEMASRAEENLPEGALSIAGLAGDRTLRIRRQQPLEWLSQYYSRMEQRDRHAA